MNGSLLMSKWGKRVARQLMKPIQKKKPAPPDTNRWNIVKGDQVNLYLYKIFLLQSLSMYLKFSYEYVFALYVKSCLCKMCLVLFPLSKVQIIQGPQSGQKGEVLQVLREKNRILIDGCNMRRRVIKPLADGTPGRIVTRPCTIHYSNVMLIDPSNG